MTGKVYLIGAGPGDPGLLTLRGAELLRIADAVLYDGLLDARLLALANPNAELVCVGKRGHGGVWSQSQINDSIVEHAQRHRHVVRLKGGDTSVFARTAEELDRLVEEQIPFEVVPGITTALAVGAYAGIPLTHRDWSSAVALVTGQYQAGDGSADFEEQIDWKALAHFPGTVVVYMGHGTAPIWSASMIAAGKPESTPVAIIRRCTWPDQRVVHGTLGRLPQILADDSTLTAPILVVIGEVAQHAPRYDWFTQRRLHGHCLLIASPEPSASKLAKLCAEQGASVVRAPSMRIDYLAPTTEIESQLRDLSRFDWIVFSSQHGVESFWKWIEHAGLDARCLGRCRIATVGIATSSSLQQHGLRSDLEPKRDANAEALLQELAPLADGKRCLVVRTPSGSDVLSKGLRAGGAIVDELYTYDQIACESWPQEVMHAVRSRQVSAILVTSSNTARHAVRILGESARQLRWVALSSAIASELNKLGIEEVRTAGDTSFDALVDAAALWLGH